MAIMARIRITPLAPPVMRGVEDALVLGSGSSLSVRPTYGSVPYGSVVGSVLIVVASSPFDSVLQRCADMTDALKYSATHLDYK